MHFFPILSTLRRHRTAAALIVLQIALTCAIVCNAIFLIRARLARMDTPSGIVEDEIVRVQLTGIGAKTDADAVTRQDLAALRAIPGVQYAAVTNQVPFGRSSWNSDASTIPDDPSPPFNATTYLGSADLLETLGVHLIAGRDFTPDEYIAEKAMRDGKAPSSMIVTRKVAEKLFGDASPIGKRIYMWGKDPQIIVGEVEVLARPSENGGRSLPGFSTILPINTTFARGGNYLLRVNPARKTDVLAAVDATLNRVDPSRIILKHQGFDEIRREYFKQDRAMAYLLVGVSIALLIITALGVVGLASFWVQQRTRQIGVRRALGATRGDILRYFQLENFILASIGIALGMALAYAINLWLMNKYHVERLPAAFLPVGAALLWALGQIAVLGPAMRAALIPPAIATRSV
jgi:putative ABC transport system permease protein